MRSFSGMVLTAVVIVSTLHAAEDPVFNPHADPVHGVLRIETDPSTRGQCSQCHTSHSEDWGSGPYPYALFTENTNQFCFSTSGDAACHQAMTSNYPLDEFDRLPETEPEAGYFEAQQGGQRRPGVDFRGRWPGESVYTNPSLTSSGHYYSPHAQDSDMLRRDSSGEGLCLNCHDPHGTSNPHDLLLAPYRAIAGHNAVGPPEAYRHCFTCHGKDGPAGMEIENQYIEDYYDSGLNGAHAGHQIRKNSRVALSWPANVRVGDMLPCYDCHNPHGSQGNNGADPNAFLISDQRSGWSGLTDTLNDPEQARRFCFGCHIPADGVPGSQQVEGIVMNTISSVVLEHRSMDRRSCYDCHGRDYSSPSGNNVHNPLEGERAKPPGPGDEFEP